MKYQQKKSIRTTPHVPEPNASTVREILARAWKPEMSSLKREEWRQIVLERLG